jgi:hypothetical protein
MKTLFASLIIAAGLAAQTAAQDHHGAAHKGQTQAATAAAGEVVKRGEPLGKAEAVKFAEVFKEPQKYAGKRVLIEGVVERVCQKEGCWMQIAPEAGSEESVRVTFDHKFAVPKDAGKWRFRAEGEFSVKTLSKEHVEHLVKDDGAKIKTNPDGTANEISFLAAGVELWK